MTAYLGWIVTREKPWQISAQWRAMYYFSAIAKCNHKIFPVKQHWQIRGGIDWHKHNTANKNNVLIEIIITDKPFLFLVSCSFEQ